MAKRKDTLQDLEIEYCQVIKDFVNSEAWKKYALPMINQVVTKELPKPGTERWQEKYMYAFALSEAFTLIINTLTNLSGKDEFIKKMQKMLDEGGANPSQPIDEA